MSNGLKFKTTVLDTERIISIAHENGVWYINSVRGELEMKIAYTDEAFEALIQMSTLIKAEQN